MSNAEFFGFFKKAAKLSKDPHNGCHIVQSQRHFALSPRYLGRLKKGAMESLEADIGRYSESLRGVPLAYSNLQILQQAGTILDDQPFIHFNVSFRAVVFQPAMGSILKCIVNEFAGDHISCLVHNWFNLSLPLLGNDLEQRLTHGSKVMAKVTKIQAKNGILAIQAIPTGVGFAASTSASDAVEMELKAEPSSDLGAQSPSMEEGTTSKQKHDSGFISDPDTSIGPPLEAELLDDDHKKRKKKKRKEEVVVKEDNEMEVGDGEGSDGLERTSGDTSFTESMFIKEEVIEEGTLTMGTEEIGTDGNVSIGSHKKKKKKRKEREEEMSFVLKEEEISQDNAIEDDSMKEKKEKKKKKKKRKGNDDDGFELEELDQSNMDFVVKEEPVSPEQNVMGSEIGSEKKKKKKKRKGNDSFALEEVDQSKDIFIKEEPVDPEEQEIDLEITSEKKKKKKKRKGNESFALDDVNQSKDDIVIKEEPVSPEEQDMDLEITSEKKKKKKKRKGNESFALEEVDQSKGDIVIKEERVSPEEQEMDLEITSEKKKKKKKKHSLDHSFLKEMESSNIDNENDLDEKPNVAAESEKKKKKKKSMDLETIAVTGNWNFVADEKIVKVEEGIIGDEDQNEGQKIKKKKHKRKLDDNENIKKEHIEIGMNGTGDHSERTTQVDVSGTVDDGEYVPPKKKKKKIKKEVD